MTVLAVLLGIAWGCLLAVPLLRRARDGQSRGRSRALRPAGPRRPAPRSRLAGVAMALVAVPVRVLGGRARHRDRVRAVERAMPLTLDVLTMASRAGYTPRLALGAAARWSPAATSALLAEVEHRCRLGSALVDALDDVGRDHPDWRAVVDALAVAERSGAPTAELLARLADDARAALRRRAEAHARKVPVRLLFPLVFLVLPAFGLLTVVPALLAGLRHS